MTEEQRISNRKQLAMCFIDLANRAKETDEPAIHSLCLVIAGTITEGTDEILALWVAEYARARIEMIQQDLEDEKET